jgi:hypothetical protein
VALVPHHKAGWDALLVAKLPDQPMNSPHQASIVEAAITLLIAAGPPPTTVFFYLDVLQQLRQNLSSLFDR